MYKIVNYDRWWSYEKLFNTFEEAFMIQQLLDTEAIIEDWSSGEPTIAYDTKWEQFSSPEMFDINIHTPITQAVM